MRIAVKTGQWGWSFDELIASWRTAEDAGFAMLSCFDHLTAAPGGKTAWDAPSLLCVMACETEQIPLAAHVLNTSLRHPFLLAAQLAVAQAASGGRVQVGLGGGSGFARLDHKTTGIPFPHFKQRLARLEACCRVLPALWRGEQVTDESLGLAGASLGPIGIEPPRLVLGGKSEEVLRLATRYADGWNAVELDPAEYARLSSRLDALAQDAGRDRPLVKEVQIWVRDLNLLRARGQLERFEDA